VSLGVVPSIVAEADEHASRRFIEFFAGTIRNKNTRQSSCCERAKDSQAQLLLVASGFFRRA
jgi:hypothetical protein